MCECNLSSFTESQINKQEEELLYSRRAPSFAVRAAVRAADMRHALPNFLCQCHVTSGARCWLVDVVLTRSTVGSWILSLPSGHLLNLSNLEFYSFEFFKTFLRIFDPNFVNIKKKNQRWKQGCSYFEALNRTQVYTFQKLDFNV